MMRKHSRINMDKGVTFNNGGGKYAIIPGRVSGLNQNTDFSICVNFIPTTVGSINVLLQDSTNSVTIAYGSSGIGIGLNGYYEYGMPANWSYRVGTLVKLVVKYRGSDGLVKAIVDGIEVLSYTYKPPFTFLVSNVYIAKHSSFGGEYWANAIVSSVKIFNTLITTSYIEAMHKNGNWIPAELHANVVEHLTCQETSGDKLYSCVEDYNYAKVGTSTANFGSDHLGFNGFTRVDGSTPPMGYPYTDSNYFDAAYFFVAPDYSVPRIARKIYNLSPGNHTFTYDIYQNAGTGYIKAYDGAGTLLYTSPVIVDTGTVTNITFNLVGSVFRVDIEFHDGNQTRVYNETVVSTGLTNNHADLVGYTSDELLLGGGARVDLITKQPLTRKFTGKNIVPYGDFSSNTGWLQGFAGGFFIADGVLNTVATEQGFAALYRDDVTIRPNSKYRVTITIVSSENNSKGIWVKLGHGADEISGTNHYIPGTYTEIFTTGATMDLPLAMIMTYGGTCAMVIDNFIVEEEIPETIGALFVDGSHTVPYPSGSIVLAYKGYNVLAYKLKPNLTLSLREELEIKANSQFVLTPTLLAKAESIWIHNEFSSGQIKDILGTVHLTVSGYSADELNPAHPNYAIKTLNSLR